MFDGIGAADRLGAVRELMQRGELEGALAAVERVIGLGKSVEALELKSEILGAIVAKNRSPEEEAQIWFDRGYVFYLVGDWQNAIDALNRSVEQKPDFDQAWCCRGVSLANLGRHEEAVNSYEEALKHKSDPDAWSNRGNSLANVGRYQDAINSYEEAIKHQFDHHDAWHNRGFVLSEYLSRYEEAIHSFDEAVKYKADDYNAWFNRGTALNNLGQHEAAISSYEEAIKYKSDDSYIWYKHGVALADLGCHEEAINSYDCALRHEPADYESSYNRGVALEALGQYEEAIASFDYTLYYKPDSYKALHNRGVNLEKLSRYEEAITSFERAVQHEPDCHRAWLHRGINLANLGYYEQAIHSYDQITTSSPEFHKACCGRGAALFKLHQYEAAVYSYDQSLESAPEFHQAWLERSVALFKLNRHEEAIYSLDQSLKHSPDFHIAWCNRGIAALSSIGQSQPSRLTQTHLELNQRGYPGQLGSLTVGLIYCSASTHPLGHGYLQRAIGDAHWNHAPTQSNPRYYRRQALTAYEASLRVLTASDYPEERLQTLQKLIRTHDALRDIAPDAMQALLRQGTELRTRILTQARSDEQRERLTRTLPNFNELTVDFHLSQGDNILALETAEADKNGLMQWLLPVPGTANYAEMRETISVDTAIVYWYLGANAIATFVLRADQVEPIVVTEFDREISLKMRDRLDEWIKTWNKNYTVHRQKSKESNINKNSDWQNTLPTELESLAEILNIPALLPHLQNIQNLILVPHRDLHRFPLHNFFPKTNITYLPSLHLGRHLHPVSALTPNLLNVVAPDHADLDPLPDASIESHALDRMLKTRQIPTTQLTHATHQTLTDRLTQPHNILHFNGHAGYNNDNPKLSSLGLQGDDRLTTIDLTKLPSLSHYNLITLTSCETAITGNQTITAEYVGLVSGFLGHRIPHVLSTLWTIESAASNLFILQFYRQILKGKSPAQALAYSQTWMKNVTVCQLDRHYSYWIDRLPGNDRIRAFLKTERDNLGTMEPNNQPYSHPYYWAAFILSGRS